MLTAYINDYGRDEAYKQFLSEFVDDDTFVILISSSGNSMNVFNCALHCKSSDYKFCVDAKSYGVVEIAHETLLHSIIDN